MVTVGGIYKFGDTLGLFLTPVQIFSLSTAYKIGD